MSNRNYTNCSEVNKHYAVYLGTIKAYDLESSSVMLSLIKDKSFVVREESFHLKSFSGP